MSAKIEKGAPGVVFAVLGLLATVAVFGLVYAIQHAALVFGPEIRNWLLNLHPLLIACVAYGLIFALAVWGMIAIERSRKVKP